MSRPLDGIRVLDLTTSIAGPYCTLILGALGADVIKIEHPERGDDTRSWGPPFWNGISAAYLSMNANKKSLAVDLKKPSGRDIVLRLAEKADIFVQNLRPGEVERLGLGFDVVKSRNSRVIYCSIGAYGDRGPLKDQPGYDPLMQAAAGIMSVTGEPERPPSRAGVSVVDQGTGMWAVIAILSALRVRDTAGAQHVKTSLYEVAVNWLAFQIAGYLGTGNTPRPMGSALGLIAPYEAFQAGDGWLMLAAGNDRQFAALCRLLGMESWVSDPRFKSNPDRVAHRAVLSASIADKIRGEAVQVWLERLRGAGVPAAPVQDIAQVVSHPQTEATEILKALPHPKIPEQRLVRFPLDLGGVSVDHVSPAPSLGEDSAAILAAAGYSPAETQLFILEGVVRGDS
ncbi:MAG: CoA transferase [Nitrospirae bacterium]|nr:CoA transferase [Nitrospirota bacterium]